MNADSILLECPSSCVRRIFICVLHNEGETKVQTTDVVNEKIKTMGDTADIESMQGQTHSHCTADIDRTCEFIVTPIKNKLTLQKASV